MRGMHLLLYFILYFIVFYKILININSRNSTWCCLSYKSIMIISSERWWTLWHCKVDLLNGFSVVIKDELGFLSTSSDFSLSQSSSVPWRTKAIYISGLVGSGSIYIYFGSILIELSSKSGGHLVRVGYFAYINTFHVS